MVRISRTWAVVVTAAMIGAVLMATPSSSAAYPPSCRETFPAFPSLQHFAVPPSATTSNSIAVPVVGRIADIDVRIWAFGIVGADFSFGPDDDFAAHRVDLDSVGGTVDLAGATYDDETGGPRTGSSPFSGSYRPVTPLSSLDGSPTKRSWRLQVLNSSTGTLQVEAWSITITYAGCAPDRDSDGVSDALDSCPRLVAHTTSGCPIASRSLTAKYKHGAFKGVLSSSAAGCRAARPVTIWKLRSGADRKIRTKTTRADGSYKLARAKKKGKYYATSPAVVVPNAAACSAVTSRSFRIR